MKKLYLLLPIVLISLCFYACKKSDNNKTNQYPTLIVGTWLQNTDHTLVYSLTDNTLVKDSTKSYSGFSVYLAMVYIFKANGDFFVTTAPGAVQGPPDTVYRLHYSISGSTFTYNQVGDTAKYHWPIVNLTSTNLQFSNTFNAKPDAGWGLDVNTTYKFVDGVVFLKE